MRENPKCAAIYALAGIIFTFCATLATAQEEWSCDKISRWAQAFSAPEEYLTRGWIRLLSFDVPASSLAHCVDMGILGANGQDEEGWSVLHSAILRNEPTIVAALLRAGADPNVRNKLGATPLHTAAFARDNPTTVKALLKAGADVNARNENGTTPLHWASSAANVVALLEGGANVNARTKDGHIPLHLAAHKPKLAVIAELLKAGSELNARTTDGLTPLHLAAMTANDPETVIILLDAGANAKLKGIIYESNNLT